MNEEQLRRCAARQDGVVTARQCIEAGIGYEHIKARVRSGAWRRLCRGTYLIDATGSAPDDRRAWLRAALLALGDEAVAVLETAAELHGIAGLPRTTGPVHVSRPRVAPRAHRPNVRVHHLTLRPEHVTELDGVRVTTPQRTLLDLVCRLDRAPAVSLLDSALHRRLVSGEEVAGLPALLRGRRGGARARRWLSLVDGRAESPLETRTRLACVDGNVPPDELQYPIRDRHGTLLGIADLAWPRRWVVAEADGAGPHEEPQALFRDRRRQNDLANAGWTVLRFTWADAFRRGYVAATVRRALAISRAC